MNKYIYEKNDLPRKGVMGFCIFYIFLIVSCSASHWDYAEIAIQNDLSSPIENVSIIYTTPWYSDALFVAFSDLIADQKSDYINIECGYQYGKNFGYDTIRKMEIVYTVDGYYNKYFVFYDGLSFAFSYDSLTEEEYSKVYIKKDTKNTVHINENGIIILSQDN